MPPGPTCREEKVVPGEVPVKEGARAWTSRGIKSMDMDLEDGSWDEAKVDMVPDRVARLSVSQLDPDVFAAEEEAAVPDCRRGNGER